MNVAGGNCRFRLIETPLGTMAIVVRGDLLAGLSLPERSTRRLMSRVSAGWPEARADRGLLPSLTREIAAYFAGRAADFDIALDLSGRTDFQQRILRQCRKIPAGQVATYGQLAHRAGRPRAARAVGRAMALNPVPLIIPCHRVVAADGALGGFSAEGGLALKARLLEHEKRFWGSDAPQANHQT
ncbi:MAG: methylated-DNA--[protein]-cysteine S-methyltransferase [Anaerolineaceae bacterium]|nr:methylated-DNA--[protein]-cysteine S-methyltransferase [Anaerolineaceae bacterium]